MGRMAVVENHCKTTLWLRLAWLGVSGLCLVLVYALSLGPMIWLSGNDYLSPATRQFLSDFYAPLWIVSNYVPFLNQFLHWYIGFFD
jgi:hypothetical protein